MVYHLSPSTEPVYYAEREDTLSHKLGSAEGKNPTIDPSTFERIFAGDGIEIPRKISTEYNTNKSRLVIKMPNPMRTEVGLCLGHAIKRALMPMELDEMANHWANVSFEVGCSRSRLADMGRGPRRHPPGIPKRPPLARSWIGSIEPLT